MNTVSTLARWHGLGLVCSIALLPELARPALSADPEFRGMWVTRFEWPNPTNAISTQNNINTFFNNLQTHRFNAVVFQVRGQMDTFYPSPYEPWASAISSDGETSNWGSFDALAFAINAAHTRGLEFHAYINTHVCWQGTSPPNYAPPGSAKPHPYWSHFNAADPDAQDWLIHDNTGTPVQTEESNYVWAAPGVPDFQAYTRRQVMYVVENYDVDGVHFDRIRLPGPEYSYDPISQARRLGAGNPHGLTFENWTRDQITRMLRDLYAQIMEVKPWIKVSSAPLGLYRAERYAGYPPGICDFQYGYSCAYQDAQAWIAAGAMDFIVPQIYWADGGSNPDFSEVFPDWVANDAGRHIVAGQIRSANVSITEILSQINITRAGGGFGNVVFSYGSINNNNNWSSYSSPGGPYEETAEAPGMPWKDTPTQGISIGNVTGPDHATPVVDSQITRTGSSYVALSSGDGLYSFLLVDPGTYSLTLQKACAQDRVVTDVSVVAGQVTRVDVALMPETFGDYDLDCDVDIADYTDFESCLGGPGSGPVAPECEAFDADADDDVDLQDAAALGISFTG